MSKYFFATRADWEPGLHQAEACLPIKYIKHGFHPTAECEVHHSALDIPQFGISPFGRVNDMMYLVLPAHAHVHARPVPQYAGGVLYYVDTEQNPDGFWIRPGGWYEAETGKCLVGGEIARYSNSEEIRTLYQRYIRTVTRGFVVVPDQYNRKWWVGLEAMSALKSGIRLVTNEARLPSHLQTYLSLNGYSHLFSRKTQ